MTNSKQFSKHKQIQLIPTKNPQIFKVQLNLTFQTRHTGKIDFTGDGTFTTERKVKHVHRHTNSLGINHELLYNPEIPFKWIVIKYLGRNLVTTREYYKAHSIVFQFEGFEKQNFLNIDLFGREQAEKYEKKIAKQFNLFTDNAA